VSERPLIRMTWHAGLRPDALAVVRVADASILLAIERDLGTERGPILAGKVDSYQRVYDGRQHKAPLHVGFVVDSARRAASVRSRLRGTEKDESVVTVWVVTEPALAADPYGAVWTTPGGTDARSIDFAAHWTGDPWPYLHPGELADPTTLEVLDDRVYRRVPMLADAL
jgi:Replication-relaxation